MVRRCTFFVLIFFSPLSQIFAQKDLIIKGKVRDSLTETSLEAVSVQLGESTQGTYTDEAGQFEINTRGKLPVQLVFSYIGYGTKTVTITDSVAIGAGLDIRLSPSLHKLEEVIIAGNSLREKFQSTNTSIETIEARQAEVLPALFGEIDIIKTLQLKPGIMSGSEGSSGLYIRGGSGDQNLIQMDGITVYNPNHLFGFFSAFNNDFLQSADVYKGGFPARYGGRLSSVIDVQSKTPDPEKFSGAGGIGLISSRLMLEGPVSDKISFIVSGRRTYVDLFTEMANEMRKDQPDFSPIPRYWFYDLNTKVTIRANPSNRFTVSGFMNNDVFGFQNKNFAIDFTWGNKGAYGEWKHTISDRLFLSAKFYVTEYNYKFGGMITDLSIDMKSRVNDTGHNWELTYESPSGHLLQAGFQWMHHRFGLGKLDAELDEDLPPFLAGSDPEKSEWALFVNDQFSPRESVKINVGLRYSGFQKSVDAFHRLEPRLAVNAQLSDRWNVKSSYTRMNQYLHLVAVSGFSLPTDLWYPTTEDVPPQVSDQVVVGANYMLSPSVLLTNEYYYKSMRHQVELKDHADIFLNEEIEDEFTFGNGYAYGTEIGLEKKAGDWTGWIGYTLAWVKRGDFPEIENGRYYSPQYDRRHDLSLVSSYRFNEKWTVSGAFVFGSGDRTWLPSGRFYMQGVDRFDGFPAVPVYGERNTIILPDYHRLDLTIVRHFKAKWGEHNLNLSFYNVYNRRNPYFLYMDTETEEVEYKGSQIEVPVKTTARQVSLFPVLPSLSWNFKF